ncbi:hypothetical protein EDB80DRAFT_876049 [Ilyonectria destructans]|nr:hypothetical protein EDB80DRAFT_876049 [Ilyonectria destructans]
MDSLCINKSETVEISHQLGEYSDFTYMPRPLQNTLPNQQLPVHEVAGPNGTEATLAEEEATKVFKLVEIFATGGHFNLKQESVDHSKQEELRALGRLADLRWWQHIWTAQESVLMRNPMASTLDKY